MIEKKQNGFLQICTFVDSSICVLAFWLTDTQQLKAKHFSYLNDRITIFPASLIFLMKQTFEDIKGDFCQMQHNSFFGEC